MSKTCLFIGRFQPAHYGTVDAIEQIKEAGYSRILFGIGSGDKEYTPDNPLTYGERKEVLAAIMKEIFPDMEVDYATIPDFGDNDSWFNYIITNLPPFEAIASGNDRTKDIFASRGYEIVSLTIRKLVKASNIRKFIKDNTREKCTDLVPAEALAVLKGYKFTERLRTICPPEKKKLIVQISVKHYEEEKVIELDPDKSITEHIQSLFDTNNTEILARGVTEHIDEYEHTITLHYSL